MKNNKLLYRYIDQANLRTVFARPAKRFVMRLYYLSHPG
jgi:hypothetical protein